MGVALYRKYRSKSLNEIVGQEHITTALQNAVKQGRISHAYLFAGPRGVGKTSIARILAHLVNGLDYADNSTHLDIIEIDAASNRRIDEIRELRERVHTAPTSAKYKVYIIDEVHMLTREAFNALLKTLEEPPEHAIFILATTEAHKLPETIISRTQRYHFKPIDVGLARDHLRVIADMEDIKIDDDALDIIAKHGDGSFRDSISLLDQVRTLPAPATSKDILEMLGIPPAELVQELYTAVTAGNQSQLIQILDGLFEQGFLAPQIAKQLSQLLRKRMINGTHDRDEATLLKDLLEIPASHDPTALLEVTLLTASSHDMPPKPHAAIEQAPAAQPKTATTTPKEKTTSLSATSQPQDTKKEQSSAKPKTAPSAAANPSAMTQALDQSAWEQALLQLKQKHNTLYSIVRMAEVRFEPDRLVLEFGFPFHQKRMIETKNSQVLSEIIHGVTGGSHIISYELKQGIQPAHVASAELTEAQPSAVVDTISNIFGGAEVLE
jgi:DNA polymerase-3 subunit gamma/tau